jgi:lysophospholipase L1-like esterase
MKKTLYWILTLIFPLLIFGLIELLLIIGGYNEKAQDLFVEVPTEPEFLMTNSDFVTRYFPTFKPQVAVSPFLKKKSEDTYRVFVLGGSSALGFPYNFYYSFAEQLEQKLLLNTSGQRVEVINLGMTAVNSYVIRDLSKRLVDYNPDAIIIYAGHNEYYGSFGAGTTQFGLVNKITIKRLVLSLKNLRLYQLMENLFRAPIPENEKQRTMMASVIREAEIELGGEVFRAGIEQFEHNLGDVVELFKDREVPLYIGTVASNLKDQAPLSDESDANRLYAEAQQKFDNGDKQGALEMYREAKEMDEIRFRAPEKINEIIRDFATQQPVELVEVEEMLRRESKSGIEDESLFIDHLHPNIKGHELMANLFIEHLFKREKLKKAYSPNVFDVPNEISQFEATFADVTISRLLTGYPFQKGLTESEEANRFNSIYNNYIQSSYIDSIAAFIKVNQKRVPNALEEIVDREKRRNDTLQVLSHYYELLKWQINSISLIEQAIEYGVNNPKAYGYLVNIIEQVLNEGAYDPRYMNVLSSVYMENRALEKAKYWMDESLKLGSEEPILFYNFTRYYLSKNDTVKASEYYNRFLKAQRP